MAAAAASASRGSLADLVDSLPRASEEPIRKIPKYVFENCNQVTCNEYVDAYFELLRGRVAEMTKAPTTERAEEIDWIHGLNKVEEELLTPVEEVALTVEDVMRLNGYFSRIVSGEEAGKVRERAIHWPKQDLSTQEAFFFDIIRNYLWEVVGSQRKSLETHLNFFKRSQSYVSEDCIIRRFRSFKLEIDTGQMLINGSLEHLAELRAMTDDDIRAIFQKLGANHKNAKGKVDVIGMYFEFHHHFPLPEEIKPQLRASLKYVNNTDNPTILRACRIWYDIVAIHISHEANKRSGKAIGSAILLRGGYLPPKIGKEYSKEYVGVMMDGFRKKGDEGFKDFVRFVVERMKETHASESADKAEA